MKGKTNKQVKKAERGVGGNYPVRPELPSDLVKFIEMSRAGALRYD